MGESETAKAHIPKISEWARKADEAPCVSPPVNQKGYWAYGQRDDPRVSKLSAMCEEVNALNLRPVCPVSLLGNNLTPCILYSPIYLQGGSESWEATAVMYWGKRHRTRKQRDIQDKYLEKRRRRMKDDEEYRKNVANYQKEYRIKNSIELAKKRRERYKNDPEYRERITRQKKESLKRNASKTDSSKKRALDRNRYIKFRFQVLSRDSFCCRYCGKRPPEVILEIDHVVPRSKGGESKEENYVASCRECNSGKFDVLLEEHLIKIIKHKWFSKHEKSTDRFCTVSIIRTSTHGGSQ